MEERKMKNKNIDKGKDQKLTSSVVDPDESGIDGIDLDEDQDEESTLKFDLDGNIVADEDDEELEDPENEEEADDSGEELDEGFEEEEAEEESDPVKKKDSTSRKISSAEIKIIELKKEKQKLIKEKQDLQKALTSRQEKKAEESAISDLISKGFDEETAKQTVQTNSRFKQIEQDNAILKFMIVNDKTFMKYPEAKEHAELIKKQVDLGLMTADQVCKVMFGGNGSQTESRARDAARGYATRDVDENGNRISNVNRASVGSKSGKLTESEEKDRLKMEKLFKQKVSVEDYIKYTK
jgi:hypothetical protein